LDLPPERGVLVEDLQVDGPADKAGIKAGDVLLTFGGSPLRNVRDLALELYLYNIGDTVSVQVLRNDVPFSAKVALTKSDDDRKGSPIW